MMFQDWLNRPLLSNDTSFAPSPGFAPRPKTSPLWAALCLGLTLSAARASAQESVVLSGTVKGPSGAAPCQAI